MIIFSVINHKGGVGKTTTAVNFAAAAAYSNKNVVLIDTDPQGSATSLFSVTELEKDFMNCFEDNATFAGSSLFLPTSLPGLSIIGATSRISKQQIKATPEAAEILRAFCHNIPKADIVVFDCSPAITNLSKIILAASDEVIIPTTPTWFALEGIAKTLKTFQEAQELTKNDLYINGVLLGKVNFFEKMTKASREIRKKLKKPLYRTTIPESKLVPKAEYESRTIFEEDPHSKVSQSFLALFNEALDRRQQRLRAQFENELYAKNSQDELNGQIDASESELKDDSVAELQEMIDTLEEEAAAKEKKKAKRKKRDPQGRFVSKKKEAAQPASQAETTQEQSQTEARESTLVEPQISSSILQKEEAESVVDENVQSDTKYEMRES